MREAPDRTGREISNRTRPHRRSGPRTRESVSRSSAIRPSPASRSRHGHEFRACLAEWPDLHKIGATNPHRSAKCSAGTQPELLSRPPRAAATEARRTASTPAPSATAAQNVERYNSRAGLRSRKSRAAGEAGDPPGAANREKPPTPRHARIFHFGVRHALLNDASDQERDDRQPAEECRIRVPYPRSKNLWVSGERILVRQFHRIRPSVDPGTTSASRRP